jgi:hypothetical protein
MYKIVAYLNPDKGLIGKMMILSAKLILPVLLILQFLPSQSQGENESDAEYRRRLEREEQDRQAGILFYTVIILLMVKEKSFSSLSLWMKGLRTNKTINKEIKNEDK